jgi:hypothetical protein
VAYSSKEKTEHPGHGVLGFSNNAVNILIVATTFLLALQVPEQVPEREPEPFQVPEPERQVPEQASSPLPSGRR